MKHLFALSGLMTLLLFSGCSSTFKSVGDVGMAAVGGVAGAALGEAVDDSDAGRIGGAIVGVIAAQQVAEQMERNNAQQVAEAYEQGRREARVEAANEFWNQKTYSDGSHPNLSDAQDDGELRQVQHDTRYVEGVQYGSSYVSYDQEPRR